MVCTNLVHNCPVTPRAIRNTNHVFGPDVASLQGKMVQPSRVKPSFITIPPEIYERNWSVLLVADIMFVNGLPFLVTISQNIALLTIHYLPDMRKATLKHGMLMAVSIYQKQNMQVTTAMVDGHFDCLWNEVGDVDLNLTAAGEHAPEIEHATRTIKERVHCTKAHLPYKRMPARMIIGLLSFTLFWLNACPHTNNFTVPMLS